MTAAEFRAARGRLGMTQKQFAEALGVAQAQVSQIETGKREPSRTVDKLVAVLVERTTPPPPMLR